MAVRAIRTRQRDKTPLISLRSLLDSAFSAVACYDISDVLAHLRRIRLISEPERGEMERAADTLGALRSFLVKDTRRIDTFMNAVRNYADDVHACMMSAQKMYEQYRSSEYALRKQEMIQQAQRIQAEVQQSTREERLPIAIAEKQQQLEQPPPVEETPRLLSQDNTILDEVDDPTMSFDDHGYHTMTTQAQDDIDMDNESVASSTNSSHSTLDFERLLTSNLQLQHTRVPDQVSQPQVMPCSVVVNNYHHHYHQYGQQAALPAPSSAPSIQHYQNSLPIQRTLVSSQCHSAHNDSRQTIYSSPPLMKIEVLKKYHKELYSYLDPETLTPYLQQHDLLTADEVATINENIGRRRRCIQHILSILPTKGPQAFDAFLNCLVEETTHVGHKVLAELLQKAVETTYQ